MGIAERRSKHKENLRQAILDAAKKLFLRDGYHATSIRKIAQEIEFSPTTIYLYYKDKAEIAHALHIEGFKLLGQQLSVVQHIDDPFERLKVMGRIYIQFSLENTDFYELMFVLKEPMIISGRKGLISAGKKDNKPLKSCGPISLPAKGSVILMVLMQLMSL